MVGQLTSRVSALRTVAHLTDRNKQVQYVCDSVSMDVAAGTAPVREDLQHVLNADHAVAIDVCAATFGDLLIQQGVPIPTVARLMRHSDGGALLLKRYARPSIETVVDLRCGLLSNGPCAASGRL
jgi:hypothetical protein